MDVTTSTSATTIRLKPRVLLPLAMIAASIFFTFLVGTAIAWGVAWDPWWMAPISLFFGALAVMYLRTAALMLASRRAGIVGVDERGFTLHGVRTPREEVICVRYDADFTFKGTCVQLKDGSFIKLPAEVHRPGRVLAAFRRCGYPIG